MSLLFQDARNALAGLWRLARGEGDLAGYLDISAAGFWRSFSLAIAIGILDGLDTLIIADGLLVGIPQEARPSLVLIAIEMALTSFCAFMAFPLVVALLARPMGIGDRVVSFIVARNWMIFLINLPVYAADILAYGSDIANDLHNLILLVMQIAGVYLGYRVARVMLNTSLSMAIGYALLDFLLALILSQAAFRFLF